MKIGLLSDTHGFLDPAVFRHFDKVDEIWHAGDIGPGVADQLANFKPLIAVYGNIDDQPTCQRFPENVWRTIEGVRILMTHIAGTPPNYNPRVRKILSQQPADVVICGHSHICKVKRDPDHGNLLYVNPGAAGNHGFHHIKTMLRFEVSDVKIHQMEVIELGKRGALPASTAVGQ